MSFKIRRAKLQRVKEASYKCFLITFHIVVIGNSNFSWPYNPNVVGFFSVYRIRSIFIKVVFTGILTSEM